MPNYQLILITWIKYRPGDDDKMKTASIAAVAAVTTSLLLATSSPATAETYGCNDAGYICMWENDNFGSRLFSVQRQEPNLNVSYIGFDNKASSAWNRTSDKVVLYQDANYGPGLLTVCMYPGVYIRNLGDLHRQAYGSLGDRASSVARVSGCPLYSWVVTTSR